MGWLHNRFMRIKADSRDTTRRFQRQVEDPETVMNALEAKAISQSVGIDPSEATSLSWFFELLVKLRLPKGWRRELSTTGELLYIDERTHEQQRVHPSLQTLKVFFYWALADKRSLATFADKQTKLLPFVEEKMLRQCIGISSKRRQAEKVNLQRTPDGRVMMSKLERITPDFRQLLASRSYMLKMLVEKVFTKKEILGKGRRANALAATITDYRNANKSQSEEGEVTTTDDIALVQSIFEAAAGFYDGEFGQLKEIPSKVVGSKEYLQSTPENVVRNALLLGISQENIELYWLARLMDCLPLPPNWSRRRGSSFDTYLFEPEGISFDPHPSFLYILRQMNAFRARFANLPPLAQNYFLSMRQLPFFDYFHRPYAVDMFAYIQQATCPPRLRSAKRTPIGPSDWLLLEALRQTTLPTPSLVLAEYLEEFWRKLDFFEEPWQPAVSPYGEVVWSSNINNKSVDYCPYRPQLTGLVSREAKKLVNPTQQELKLCYREDDGSEEVRLDVDKVAVERQDFLAYYISHMDKPVPYPYEIKKAHQLLNPNNYCQQLFFSPFVLDAGVVQPGEPIPFWLEKAQAQLHSQQHINILQFSPSQFTAVREKISDYALRKAGEHEPHLAEETEKKLARISNPEDLVKFLLFTNDLDLREQRKKEYLESLLKVEEDSDIFGSQLSQLDLPEDDQEIELLDQRKDDSISDKAPSQEKSIHEEEPEISQSEETIVQEKEPEEVKPQIREDYEFLRQFRKKKARRQSELEELGIQQLQKLLKKVMQKKKRMGRYRFGLLGLKVKKQLENAKRAGEEPLLRNLIITHLRICQLPYAVLPHHHKLKRNQSQWGGSEATDYPEFLSQGQEEERGEVQQIVAEARKAWLAKQRLPTPRQSTVSEHEATRDTIELEPIYQIKPSLQMDPVLRHVSTVTREIDDFRSTFVKPQPSARISLQKSNSKDNLIKINKDPLPRSSSRDSLYASTPARADSLQRSGIRLSLGNVAVARPFHRVCLEHTASHFLQKEAFLRKGDILTMQARKSLMSKGRGLDNLISRNY